MSSTPKKARAAGTKVHASDSAAQQSAEKAIRTGLEKLLGVSLPATRVKLSSGGAIDLDGFSEGPPTILVEMYAHQGTLRGSQPKKLRADAFKLLAARALCFPNARLILGLASEDAEKSFYSGWTKAALDGLRVEVRRVTLDAETVKLLNDAQRVQRMTNAGSVPAAEGE